MDQMDLSLLDCLSEYWSPAGYFSRKDADQLFNRRLTLPSVEELADRLERQIAAGYLVAKSASRGLFIPRGAELREAVRSSVAPTEIRNAMFLGLTTLGGSKWENALHPNWDAFVLCEETRGGALRIQAASRIALATLLTNASVELRTMRVRSVHPWRPLYWKFLPEGFVVAGSTQELPLIEGALKNQRLKWLRSLGHGDRGY